MYTLMIAEDELLVRIGIASSIPWAEMNIRIVGEVEDGAKALNLYEKYHPDIIMMDIRMPEVDGITLLQRIRERDQRCQVIVITNVEHEETLSAARKLGITDILLKATMEQEDITAAIRKACGHLPALSPQTAGLQQQPSAWEAFLGGQSAEPPFQPVQLLCMHFFQHAKLSQHFRNALTDLFIHKFEKPEHFELVPVGQDLFLFFRTESDSQKTEVLLNEMSSYICGTFEVPVSFAAVLHLTGKLNCRELVQRVQKIAAEEVFFHQNAVLLNEDGLLISTEVLDMREKLQSYAPFFPADHPLHALARLLLTFPCLFHSWPGLQSEADQAAREIGMEKCPDTLHTLLSALQAAVNRQLSGFMDGIRPELRKALAYAIAHLDEDLSTERISAHLGFHPTYFSKIFKADLKLNYAEYIAELRLNRAKYLLKATNLPLKEISDRCGYSGMPYFSYCFKNSTGMAPGKWREER